MKENLQKLSNENKRVQQEIDKTLQTGVASLVKQLAEEKINEDELRDKLTNIISSTKDIIPVYRLVVEKAKEHGARINNIKERLARRLFEKARIKFMSIPTDELNEAAQLFEELGMNDESKRCKALIETMFAIAEDNEKKLDKLDIL